MNNSLRWVVLLELVNALLTSAEGTGVDVTLLEGACGGPVVGAVIDKLSKNSIFNADVQFLRHLAYERSRDGTDNTTFRAGFHGGIWQVDENTFHLTQNCQSDILSTYCGNMNSKLTIDWPRVMWSDLRKPLYSGLAAALHTFSQMNEKYTSYIERPGTASTDWNKSLVNAFADSAISIEPRSSGAVVRLVNGGFPGEGRVEVFTLGSWGTVCQNSFGVSDARVICRMLGFTSNENPVAYTNAYYGEGIGPIWLDNVGCSGSESNIFSCSHNGIGVHTCSHSQDVSVTCQSTSRLPLRLVNGARAWQGRIEIKLSLSWETVCNDLFDVRDARVICRMLGYSGTFPVYAYYGSGSIYGNIVLDDLECSGNEQSIFMCPHRGILSNNCTHSQDVGVDCRVGVPPAPLRLVNGTYPWEGRLEVRHNGVWGSVCNYSFDTVDARVVCNILGYTGAIPVVRGSSFFGESSGVIWLTNLRCTGKEEDISQCPSIVWGDTYTCNHTHDVGLSCVLPVPDTIVRLENGLYPWEGRVEVLNNETWGSVCDDSFGIKEAAVVCTMLGYIGSQPVVRGNAHYGRGTGAIWLDDVNCLGSEKSLFLCQHSGVGNHSCNHHQDVGVDCFPSPRPPARLVNGTHDWEGRVEVWHNGSWGSVCEEGFDLLDALVVCRMLGYTRQDPSVHGGAHYGPALGEIILSNISCDGNETSIYQCPSNNRIIANCSQDQAVGINCQPAAPSSPVRLTDGPYPWEGRAEVWYGGSWGAICKYNFEETDARIICRMLGYIEDQPLVQQSKAFGQSAGNIWLDNLGCRGTEHSIFHCPHNGFGNVSCTRDSLARVNCLPSAPSPPIQLSNGTYPWEGRAEIWSNGEWGTICWNSFDVSDAAVVCRMLGFAGDLPVVNKTLYYGQGSGPILMDDLSCNGTENNIFLCSYRGLGIHNCDHSKDVGINCQPSAPLVPVRLANGEYSSEGRLEVWSGGSWSTACQNNVDIKDARVICRMLGFSDDQPNLYRSTNYSQDTGILWLYSLGCNGTEHNIFQCHRSLLGEDQCDPYDETVIGCRYRGTVTDSKPVYIVGGVLSGVILLIISTIIVLIVKKKIKAQQQSLYASTVTKVQENESPRETTYEELTVYNNRNWSALSGLYEQRPIPNRHAVANGIYK